MPVTEAAERMLDERVEHLPIMSDDRLVGVVDMTAVCRALLQHAG
jgi:CBS domain-containing protein